MISQEEERFHSTQAIVGRSTLQLDLDFSDYNLLRRR